MLNPIQLEALNEIERQVAKIRAADIQIIEVNAPPLQAAINSAPVGSILDLKGNSFTEKITIVKSLTLRNGTILAPPSTDNLVNITSGYVQLKDLVIKGNLNNKNGIVAHGQKMEFDNINIQDIARVGQESHAIAMWNTSGSLSVKNSRLEAASTSFMAGGAIPTIPNTIATDLYFDNCVFTRKLEWKGKGYAIKNAFELKCARNVTVVNSILENVWKDGQSGYAIVLTPSAAESTASPLTTVENVLFQKNVIRNVGAGVNALGFTQHPEFPTQRGNNYKFIDNQWQITKLNLGHAGLVMLSWEVKDVVFESNLVVEDGDAFCRFADRKPVEGLVFQGNSINVCGTYGVFAPDGNIRGIGWSTIAPGGIMNSNTFTGAHTTFKTNFPSNTYV